ncbi:hypothetical protein CCAL9344_02185 [Campylobacter sp. RM9344]|uniref:DL-methionine ABC transporter MetINQ, substrate-binding protein n=1 Tax=Campylobacter californiensis TaxID=1032243 RepID=A0AAW3ZU16_9BACT|nr:MULTISPECIES: MetQ/NlpA family ABC transporter substrate-binding protein [unclassified Campylobacter]MBE2984624.1 hypothetical protein [Campylobacter sp. RM6883]MBE2986816.1 hypothetical protein [Campylobacter sp. RM12919]MBE2988506.1 hypothetical protein [Campylobacter sp. RM12920]MBE2995088.1 hypothetical protein [Campylobacter sp. RM6913]MBE3029009.1 hypothetical protein [Campylobacter sp. RM9344]
MFFQKQILGIVLVGALFLVGCGSDKTSSAEKKSLTLAAASFNYDEVNSPVALDALKAKGYDVRVIVLEDATTMNEAAMNGDIDASLHQHKPWMESYNKSKKRDMVMLEPYVRYNVFGCYSMKFKNIADLPEGAHVIIPDDSSNTARALNLLEQEGLVDLRKDVSIPTALDITANPKNLKIETVIGNQIPKALPDVDMGCVAKMYQVNNNISPDTQIAVSKDMTKFAVGFVVTAQNKNAPWAKDLTDAYTSDAMQDEIHRIFKDSYKTGRDVK